MQDVFTHAAEDERNLEVYEVVLTAMIVRNTNKVYRIEVLKGYSNPNIQFTTRTYLQEEISDGKKVWVLDISAPWTARNTAEGALAQAIGFLPIGSDEE